MKYLHFRYSVFNDLKNAASTASWPRDPSTGDGYWGSHIRTPASEYMVHFMPLDLAKSLKGFSPSGKASVSIFS